MDPYFKAKMDPLIWKIVNQYKKVIYVDQDARYGANNGTSWQNAYLSLQDALEEAEVGNEIWVAEGTYYPDEGASQTPDDRNSSFHLKSGVVVYGGFNGTETMVSQRNHLPETNGTILSGDIDQNGVLDSGTAYHVVTGSGADPLYQ